MAEMNNHTWNKDWNKANGSPRTGSRSQTRSKRRRRHQATQHQERREHSARVGVALSAPAVPQSTDGPPRGAGAHADEALTPIAITSVDSNTRGNTLNSLGNVDDGDMDDGDVDDGDVDNDADDGDADDTAERAREEPPTIQARDLLPSSVENLIPDETAESASQPSQVTMKLPTLAIMATVAKRPTQSSARHPAPSVQASTTGELSDKLSGTGAPTGTNAPASAGTEATALPETRAGDSGAPLPTLPPVPQTLKDALQAEAARIQTDENSTSGSFPATPGRASSANGKQRLTRRAPIITRDLSGLERAAESDTLTRLARHADVAQSALRDTLHRQSGAPHAGLADERGGARVAAAPALRGLERSGASASLRGESPAESGTASNLTHAGHQPLPPIDPVPVLAVLHAGIGAVAALLAAGCVLLGSSLAVMMLVLALVAGGTGALASLLGKSTVRRADAGVVLLLGQFAMLGWACTLVGPRAAFLLLVPGIAFWAVRVLGRGVLIPVGACSVLLYSGAVVFLLAGPISPALPLDTQAGAILDGVLVVMGVTLALFGIEGLLRETAKASARARARDLEVVALRARLRTLEAEVAAEREGIATALRRTLRLRRTEPLVGEGPLAALYPVVNALGERLVALHRDREEWLHLEGAVQRLTHAVERAWLGLPWTWPEPTGTSVDELAALLRAPGLDDKDPDSRGKFPLVPIPSAEVERERLRREADLPVSRAHSTTLSRLRSVTHYSLPELEPPASGASSPSWSSRE